MPIKNYTTKVSASQSIKEIQTALVLHGAKGVAYEYDDDGRILALNFILDIEGNRVNFSLPVNWRKFQAVLKQDDVKRWNEDDYCYRVALRNIRDWVLAQLALYETMIVDMPQIFLPFATDNSGRTLYEIVKSSPQGLLGSGDNT